MYFQRSLHFHLVYRQLPVTYWPRGNSVRKKVKWRSAYHLYIYLHLSIILKKLANVYMYGLFFHFLFMCVCLFVWLPLSILQASFYSVRPPATTKGNFRRCHWLQFVSAQRNFKVELHTKLPPICARLKHQLTSPDGPRLFRCRRCHLHASSLPCACCYWLQCHYLTLIWWRGEQKGELEFVAPLLVDWLIHWLIDWCLLCNSLSAIPGELTFIST